MWLDELVQSIKVQADTRAYDVIDKKNKQVINSSNTMSLSFKRAFGFLGAYFGVRALTRYADEWKNIDSILKLVTSDEQQRIGLQEKLFKISQDTRQEMAGTVDLYRKITVATEKLGASEEDRLKATKTINKAMLLGGGSEASNNAALVQLGQGLSADSLRGQELNSILEQSPRLAQAIADGMNLKVGDLRKYAEKNGGIKAKQAMDAILSQTGAINSEFENVNMTIGQSLTMLNNSFGRMIFGADKASSLTDNIASGIGVIAKFIDKSSVTIGIIVKYAKQLFILFVAIKALRFLAIPFDLFLLNMSEGVGLVKAFKEVLMALNLKSLIAASWALLGPWLKILGVAMALKEVIDTLQGKDTFLRDASNALGDNFNNRMASDYGDLFDTFGDGFIGKTAAVMATPALMAYNGGAVAMDKYKQSKTENSHSVVNNITQNITTTQPQAAADMMLNGLQRYNKGG